MENNNNSNTYTPPPYIPLITPAEWECFYHYLHGLTYLQIARITNRKYNTVKCLMRNIGIRQRVLSSNPNCMDACLWLRKMGFVDDEGKVVDDRFMRMKYKEIFPE